MSRERINEAIREIREELKSASLQHGQFHSTHEGYAVILEELDELWDEIKSHEGRTYNMRMEAKQVAAMAIRFMTDCT